MDLVYLHLEIIILLVEMYQIIKIKILSYLKYYLFFEKKKAPRLINTDSMITIKHSVNNIFISSIFSTKNIAAN